jgi:hypothetical protein
MNIKETLKGEEIGTDNFWWASIQSNRPIVKKISDSSSVFNVRMRSQTSYYSTIEKVIITQKLGEYHHKILTLRLLGSEKRNIS